MTPTNSTAKTTFLCVLRNDQTPNLLHRVSDFIAIQIKKPSIKIATNSTMYCSISRRGLSTNPAARHKEPATGYGLRRTRQFPNAAGNATPDGFFVHYLTPRPYRPASAERVRSLPSRAIQLYREIGRA